jgi:hypothetical protein
LTKELEVYFNKVDTGKIRPLWMCIDMTEIFFIDDHWTEENGDVWVIDVIGNITYTYLLRKDNDELHNY